MSFKVLVVFVLLINIVFVHETSTQAVFFNINSQNYKCTSSVASVSVKRNETLTVNVMGEYINEANCSTSNSPFLTTSNFKVSRIQATAAISEPTATHNGKWLCRFFIRKDNIDNAPKDKTEFWNGNNYAKVDCSVTVNVAEPENHDDSAKGPLGLDQETFYIMIGCIVGAVVIIIIIVQTIIIIYYKKRVARRNLSHLEQRPQIRRDDRTRYSTLPMRKCSRKRASSCIYQSLENLSSVHKTPPTNIKERPPMPLPNLIESDDEDSIYNAMLEQRLANCKKYRNRQGGNTLSRIFTPALPSLDTLPRRGNKSKQNKPKPAPKPTKPVHDMEDYDYANSEAQNDSLNRHLKKKPTPLQKPSRYNMRGDNAHNKVNPEPVPPKPSGVLGGPCAGAPVMNELDNLFKKRNNFNARAAEPPQFEGRASPTRHQLARRPAPKETHSPRQVRAPGLRGPQERDIREPTVAWSPPVKPAYHQQDQPTMWPQDPRPQMPRYTQEDRRPSEIARRLQETRPQYMGFEGRSRGPPYRPISPEMSKAPQLPPIVSLIQIRSPPLPRQPKPDVVRSRLGIKKPLPPPPDTDSVYEPVADGDDSTDDEEWTIEELKPYNIYNQ